MSLETPGTVCVSTIVTLLFLLRESPVTHETIVRLSHYSGGKPKNFSTLITVCGMLSPQTIRKCHGSQPAVPGFAPSQLKPYSSACSTNQFQIAGTAWIPTTVRLRIRKIAVSIAIHQP